MDFEFDGKVEVDFSFDDEQVIGDQLLYTIGHLNGNNSVGRLDDLKLTNVVKTALSGNRGFRISYHAKLPVAWGSKTNLPTTYSFILPKSMAGAKQEAFFTKYQHSCVEPGAHDVDLGSMWYYFRPKTSGCLFSAGTWRRPQQRRPAR